MLKRNSLRAKREYAVRNFERKTIKTKYSFLETMREKKLTNETFENMIAAIPLEDLIAMKLEVSASHNNGFFYGFPIWSSMPTICKEAIIRTVDFLGISYRECAIFLGMTVENYKFVSRRYRISRSRWRRLAHNWAAHHTERIKLKKFMEKQKEIDESQEAEQNS